MFSVVRMTTGITIRASATIPANAENVLVWATMIV